MEENFNPVARTRANYYTPGSPVQFVCVELLKGDVSGEHAVCLTFKNVGTEPLTGLVVHFKCKDAAGQVLCEDDFYYEQLNAQPGAVFGSDDAVYVSDTPVSSVEVEQDLALVAIIGNELSKACGVGKEVFANFVHKNSSRADKPFIAINMAAIPDNLIESELFGYEKGAFTDAQTSKVGRFEMAQGGTLFLDEIAEMPYPLQSKLLRVLQDKEITRLGGTKPIKIDVRIVSATNVNIDKNIKDGLFREDLYYRLNTIPVKIPPLRDRREEIVPIAEAVFEKTSIKYGVKKHTLTEGAKEALTAHNWPGNIRELISVCERVAILTDGDTIDTDDILQNL